MAAVAGYRNCCSCLNLLPLLPLLVKVRLMLKGAAGEFLFSLSSPALCY
jgi:hypothetical protein